MDTKLVYCQPLLDVLKEGLKCRFNDYFSFEYSINRAIIVTISNPQFKLNWLSNYVEEKDMLLSTFKKYVNRHIPDNEVYITTPEQAKLIQMNSMLLMIMDHPLLNQRYTYFYRNTYLII